MIVEGALSGKLEVRLVNPNGSREDTIRDITQAVDNLGAISNAIFATIGKRMEEQRALLGGLGDRIGMAARKVEKLKGSQKAIRIISPAKFPLDVDINLKPLVVSNPRPATGDKIGDIKLLPKRGAVPTRFDPPIKHPGDLLACYHVREPTLPSMQTALMQQGLGDKAPSPAFPLVDSYLLFNTTENPYQHYRLPGKAPRLSGKRHDVPLVLPSAMATPTQRHEKNDDENVGVDDFYYSPSTLQIPDIDVPDLLPDLPGIVENLDFPPMDFTPQPFFHRARPTSLNTTEATALNISNNPGATSTPVDVVVSAATTVKTSVAMPPPAPPSAPAPAPPPPPPPPMIPSAVVVAPTPKSSGGGGDTEATRSNLMAAIRAAGGGKATLRSAQERKFEAKKKKLEEKEKEAKKSDEAEGSDLMADLKNTLAMRRKGISGIQKPPMGAGASAQAVGDIMQKLAFTIPAMETSTDSQGFGDDDDDETEDWD